MFREEKASREMRWVLSNHKDGLEKSAVCYTLHPSNQKVTRLLYFVRLHARVRIGSFAYPIHVHASLANLSRKLVLVWVSNLSFKKMLEFRMHKFH